jgi:hypothetical protein
METLIVHPQNKKQLAASKAVMKALDISFEKSKSPYNPQFIEMLRQGDEDLKAGKGVKVDIADLWK